MVLFSTDLVTQPPIPVSPGDDDGRTIGIAVGVSVGVTLLIIVLLIIIVAVYIVKKRKQHQKYVLSSYTVYGKNCLYMPQLHM